MPTPKKNKVYITVSGTSDSGKNIVLSYIGALLAASGFKVDLASKDYEPNLHPSERIKKISELATKRQTSIKLVSKQTSQEEEES